MRLAVREYEIAGLLRQIGLAVVPVCDSDGQALGDQWILPCPRCGDKRATLMVADGGGFSLFCELCLAARRTSGWYRFSVVEFLSAYRKRGASALPVLEREPQTSSWADLAATLKATTWAWPGWLPAGMLTLVAAGLEMGKSLLALRIAASFLRGDPWPDGAPFTGETGAVVWCETESAQALNLERAVAWGLPVDLLLSPLPGDVLDFRLDDPAHRAALEAAASRDDARLVVVDSFSGGSRRDENAARSGEVTAWLAALARDTGKPTLMTHHLRKRSVFDPDPKREVTLDLIRGASAIPQTPRVIWALDQPDATSDIRRLSLIKCNIARKAEPLGMAIDDAAWPLFGACPTAPHIETAEERAAGFLLKALDKEQLPAITIFRDADAIGLSPTTVKRAKSKLGIISVKRPDGWYWGLPAPGGIE